jgi:ABC-type branched-subunit amino acid transport system substrate-binding protein
MQTSLLIYRREALKNFSLAAAGLALPFIPTASSLAQSNRTPSSSGAAVWDIVQIVDTSTLQQDVSKDFLTGARAAWQSINRQGGLQGQPVRHVVMEVDGTEASARKAFLIAQSSNSCLAISGTAGDSTSQLITQWLQDDAASLAHVAPWLQNSEQVVGHKTFAICADRQTQIAHATAYWAGFGVKEFGVIYASTQEQTSHRQEIERIGKELKIKITHMPVQGNLEQMGQTLPIVAPSVQIFVGGTPELIALLQGLETQKRMFFIMGLSDINLQSIRQLGVAKKTTIIVAQSVPLVTSPLPIVQSYRGAMARFFDEAPTPLSLTGFISARYTYEVLSRVKRPLNRQVAFNAFAQREAIDLDGFKINYKGAGRGSQFVTLSMLGQQGRTIG